MDIFRQLAFKLSQDMFFNLAPITDSPGAALMRKMGWEQGKGLGKDETGNVNPLELTVKTDKKGMPNFHTLPLRSQDA